MIYLILLLAFLTTFLLVMVLHQVFFGRRSATLRRLEMSNAMLIEASFDENPGDAKNQRGEKLKNLSRFIPKTAYLEKIRVKLLQSYIKMKPEEFISMSFLSAFLVGLLLYLTFSNIIGFALGALIGYKIPDLFINSIKKKRGKLLNSQLPQALSVISNGLRAGFSFPQAMGVASKELESPIADEFAKVLRDNSLGKPMEEALDNLNKRNDDEDLDMFITALLIQRQVGGNLSEVLDTISETIRERVKLRGEVSTLTAQGKFSALVISLLPVGIALALSMINPGYINLLFTNILGVILVVMAVVMQIIGIYIMSKMVNIDI
jgi:tight adherence protein B